MAPPQPIPTSPSSASVHTTGDLSLSFPWPRRHCFFDSDELGWPRRHGASLPSPPPYSGSHQGDLRFLPSMDDHQHLLVLLLLLPANASRRRQAMSTRGGHRRHGPSFPSPAPTLARYIPTLSWITAMLRLIRTYCILNGFHRWASQAMEGRWSL